MLVGTDETKRAIMDEHSNKAPISSANMEQNTSDEPLGEEKAQGLDTRLNITVISYRKRKHDPDGVSCKAVLDGLVRAGLLQDDSTEEIKKVTFESRICEKGQKEGTIIELDRGD
jgi:Holliday junction resolvase RusA-like endonuclease